MLNILYITLVQLNFISFPAREIGERPTERATIAHMIIKTSVRSSEENKLDTPPFSTVHRDHKTVQN